MKRIITLVIPLLLVDTLYCQKFSTNKHEREKCLGEWEDIDEYERAWVFSDQEIVVTNWNGKGESNVFAITRSMKMDYAGDETAVWFYCTTATSKNWIIIRTSDPILGYTFDVYRSYSEIMCPFHDQYHRL